MYTRLFMPMIPIVLAAALQAPGQPGLDLAIPELINYQGKLIEGTNLVNGQLSISLRLYNQPSGGSVPTCEDSGTVSVVDGIYSTYIGDNIVMGNLGDALYQTQVWIEVAINGTNVLSPRERLVSVGYALYAAGLPTGAVHSAHIGANQILDRHIADGEITGGKIAADTISTTNLAGSSVTSGKIRNGTILAADVAANTFWETGGNAGTTAGTHFLGTTDSRPMELRAGGQTALRMAYHGGSAPNLVGGSPDNSVDESSVASFIGGGDDNVIGPAINNAVLGGGYDNRIGSDADYTVVGGGWNNVISNNARNAVIGGGSMNVIGESGFYGVIAGGQGNLIGLGASNSVISGGRANRIRDGAAAATVAGGSGNIAGGAHSFAAGRNARATNNGCFVWADDLAASFGGTVSNQFLVRATGGVGINTDAPSNGLDVVARGSSAGGAKGLENDVVARFRRNQAGDAAISIDADASSWGDSSIYFASDGRARWTLKRDTLSNTLRVEHKPDYFLSAYNVPMKITSNGAVTVEGDYQYASSRTGVVYFSAMDFQSDEGPFDYYRLDGEGGLYLTTWPTAWEGQVGVSLPDGAVVRQMEVYYSTEFGNAGVQTLLRRCGLESASGATMAEHIDSSITVGGSPVKRYTTTNIFYSAINNKDYRYFLSSLLSYDSSMDAIGFRGVRLTYTYDTVGH